jgi:hypothetical protein
VQNLKKLTALKMEVQASLKDGTRAAWRLRSCDGSSLFFFFLFLFSSYLLFMFIVLLFASIPSF